MDFFDLGRFLIFVLIFFLLILFARFIAEKIKNSSNKYLNPLEYLPEEELQSEKQLFYLAVVGLCFLMFVYSLIYFNYDLLVFVVVDSLASLYFATTLDLKSTKSKIMLILLIPFGCIGYLSNCIVGSFLDFIHFPLYLYFMKVYYDKFIEYTETNSLGIFGFLLFIIIFVSLIITILTENTTPLNALVMVSNAFTSNGYAVLGHSTVGKLNSVVLVWGGFLFSGVATATLTTAILKKYFDKKFKELEDSIKKD